MLKPNHSHRKLSLKRNTSSLKSGTSLKRNFRTGPTHVPSIKDIPNIISQVEKSLSILRKIYIEETKANNEQGTKSSKLIRPHTVSLIRPQKISQEEYFQQEETTAISNELDELKKSFLSCNGFESNNIVELYNFYRKNAEKSTRLFGSTSMSNMVNLTQNQSEIRERNNKANSYIASQQNPKEVQNERKTQVVVEEEIRFPLIKNDPLTKKTNEMVRVASLLAQKKKISRTAICQNMNSQNLLNQAKKKLQRLNPCENLERSSKLKQNIKNSNIKSSPFKDKKQQNSETKRVRSIHSSKKNSAKKVTEKDFEKQIQEFSCFQQNQNPNLLTTERIKQGSQKVMDAQERQKYLVRIKQSREGVSAKSSKSFKSVKSPNSIKSPCLNRGGFLDMTGSCQKSSNKNSTQYFIPKVHANNHDSLLDCEITAKEQSRNLDLESIPFDF